MVTKVEMDDGVFSVSGVVVWEYTLIRMCSNGERRIGWWGWYRLMNGKQWSRVLAG